MTALCTPLDDPTNGMIQCSGEDGIPFEGDTCIYLCNEGYVINGGATRECLSDGTWSGSEPTCEPGKMLLHTRHLSLRYALKGILIILLFVCSH